MSVQVPVQVLSRALPPGAVLLVITVVALNLADAYLTLWHIGFGAVELNPLMRHLLDQGPVAFVAGKHFTVAICLIAIAATRAHHPVFQAVGLAALAVYASIIVYQLGLLGASR